MAGKGSKRRQENYKSISDRWGEINWRNKNVKETVVSQEELPKLPYEANKNEPFESKKLLKTEQ